MSAVAVGVAAPSLDAAAAGFAAATGGFGAALPFAEVPSARFGAGALEGAT